VSSGGGGEHDDQRTDLSLGKHLSPFADNFFASRLRGIIEAFLTIARTFFF
jgi:hypothetical protein